MHNSACNAHQAHYQDQKTHACTTIAGVNKVSRSPDLQWNRDEITVTAAAIVAHQ